jgi:hypothetical protein
VDFPLIRKVLSLLFSWRQDLRARTAKYLVTREVTKVLKLTHAQELYLTPRNEWPLVRQKQVEEIRAVRSGQQFDIIDRRSWANPYLPEALHRLNQPVMKNTPYNLRRFSETPIMRRAMNLVKNAVLSFKWVIKPTKEFVDDVDPDREQRIQIATQTLRRPNESGESFRDISEMGLEDFLLNGAMCIEHRITPYYKRPTKMWAVDSSTVRIFLDWTESTPDRPRYAQMTGLKGERGIVTFLSNELFYIKDNIRTSTPFGLGRGEVAFNSMNAFLGVQDMSTRAGSDQVHKTWLWWEQSLGAAHINTIRRHITNELEGQAKVSMIAGAKAPKVIDVIPVTPEDLLLDWQKFLIQIIAAAFDLSPQALNMDDHPNRSTAQVMADADWRSAVVPVATRLQEAWTRLWLHDTLKWRDIEFEYENLDDPDPVTRTVIQQREWTMSAITSDEVRAKSGRGPLPGKWGKMTFFQQQVILASIKGAATGGGAGGGAMGGGAGAGGGLPSAGSLGSGTGSQINASKLMYFSAEQVGQMMPDQVELLQELGLVPETPQLLPQMEEQAPGILETISDELTEYFEKQLAEKESTSVLPSPVTPEEEDEQLEKFQQDQHQESLAERVINRRGVFGDYVDSQVTKNQMRGKYPRTAGGGFDDSAGKDRVARKGVKRKLPKGNYRPGRGNTAV